MLETDGTSGAMQASYTLGGSDLLAQTRGGTVSYVLPDGQGSVRQLANSVGEITDTARYDAYGNVLSHTGSTVMPYGYDGQRLDATSGLYQLRAREYDPTTGRFTTPDSATLSPTDVAQLDRYVYAGANPINASDPSGHDLVDEASIYGSIARIAVFVGQMGTDLGLGVIRLAILLTVFCIAEQAVCQGLLNAARQTIQAYQQLLQLLNSLSLGSAGGSGSSGGSGGGIGAGGGGGIGGTLPPGGANWVVRGGLSSAQNLQSNYRKHQGVQNLYGFSVQYSSGLTIDQLAAAGRFPNGQISYQTDAGLFAAVQRLGYTATITRSPGGGYHATFSLYRNKVMLQQLPTDAATALSIAFAHMPNPAVGP